MTMTPFTLALVQSNSVTVVAKHRNKLMNVVFHAQSNVVASESVGNL